MFNNLLIAPDGGPALGCGIYTQSTGRTPALSHNDVYSATGTAYGPGCVDETGANGNVSVDPRFVDPTHEPGDLRLQAQSPAVDFGLNSAPGLPSTDVARSPRIVDGNGDGTATVDLGVYERPALAPPRPCKLLRLTVDLPAKPLLICL